MSQTYSRMMSIVIRRISITLRELGNGRVGRVTQSGADPLPVKAAGRLQRRISVCVLLNSKGVDGDGELRQSPAGPVRDLFRALHDHKARTCRGTHAMLTHINAQLKAEGQPPFEWKTIPQGAATSVWAAIVAPAGTIGSHYLERCQVSPITDGLISPISPGVRPYALDPEHAKALWARSEELVGERF